MPIQFRPSGGKIPSNIALPGAKFLGNFQRKSLGTRLGSTELVRVDSEVDLGITVTRKLSWNQHITQIVSKANKMLGLLRRTCPLLTDRVARRTLYLSLVKSQLGYATEVWSPSQFTNKTYLERIQRPHDGSFK